MCLLASSHSYSVQDSFHQLAGHGAGTCRAVAVNGFGASWDAFLGCCNAGSTGSPHAALSKAQGLPGGQLVCSWREAAGAAEPGPISRERVLQPPRGLRLVSCGQRVSKAGNCYVRIWQYWAWRWPGVSAMMT